jgi:RNA-binding protein YhbY
MLYIPHAISAEEFSINKQHSIPELIKNSFLYVGNIDNRIDFPSLFSLADSFPTEVFCLIGKQNLSESVINEIKKRNNINILEVVHFKKLKNHIAAAKGCLAIMKTDYNGNMINHHKILQYLAFGKDVYCPAFSEYSNKNMDLLCVYKNRNELLEIVAQKLEQPTNTSLVNARIEYAKSLRYEVVLEKINQFIQENAY